MVEKIIKQVDAARQSPHRYMLMPAVTTLPATPSGNTRPLPKMPKIELTRGSSSSAGRERSSAHTVSKKQLVYYDAEQIKAMTNGFDLKCMLGQGGCGRVFKGCTAEGVDVAVKVCVCDCLHACGSVRMCVRAFVCMRVYVCGGGSAEGVDVADRCCTMRERVKPTELRCSSIWLAKSGIPKEPGESALAGSKETY